MRYWLATIVPPFYVRRASVTSIVVLAAIALQGCGAYFAPDRNVTRKVAEAEVVGTWRLTAGSLALLQRDGFVADPTHAYTITFNVDGTLRFASVIDDFRSGRYFDVPGTWTLEHNTNGNSNVHKANALSLRIEVPGSTNNRYLNFAEENGKLQLWNYYGDPDSWEFMEYERDP